MRKRIPNLVPLIVFTSVFFISCSIETMDTQKDSMEKRLRILEDQAEIRQLLIEYGRTLDARDFDGFAKLFAQDAEYVGGGGNSSVKGPEAIARLLKNVFEENPTGVKSPNYHLFANETIQVNGNEALAISKGIFVVPNADNQPESVMLATYEDALVRENGAWKFKRRLVQGNIPAPVPSK